MSSGPGPFRDKYNQGTLASELAIAKLNIVYDLVEMKDRLNKFAQRDLYKVYFVTMEDADYDALPYEPVYMKRNRGRTDGNLQPAFTSFNNLPIGITTIVRLMNEIRLRMIEEMGNEEFKKLQLNEAYFEALAVSHYIDINYIYLGIAATAGRQRKNSRFEMLEEAGNALYTGGVCNIYNTGQMKIKVGDAIICLAPSIVFDNISQTWQPLSSAVRGGVASTKATGQIEPKVTLLMIRNPMFTRYNKRTEKICGDVEAGEERNKRMRRANIDFCNDLVKVNSQYIGVSHQECLAGMHFQIHMKQNQFS